MNYPDLTCTTSSTREDEIFGNDFVFQNKPFSFEQEDYSSDTFPIENTVHENPFSENTCIFQKRESIRFKNKSRSLKEDDRENWSKKVSRLNRENSLIRSAPLFSNNSLLSISNNGERITLPILGCGQSDSIKRISSSTMMALLCGIFQKEFTVVDARFKYEYDGGHIIDAINCHSEIELMNILSKKSQISQIIIFYYEFSSERGPKLAKNFRNTDRNSNKYPNLKYPEIYILEGGYKKFFKSYSNLCIPNAYIQMNDKRFANECKEQHKKIKIKKY